MIRRHHWSALWPCGHRSRRLACWSPRPTVTRRSRFLAALSRLRFSSWTTQHPRQGLRTAATDHISSKRGRATWTIVPSPAPLSAQGGRLRGVGTPAADLAVRTVPDFGVGRLFWSLRDAAVVG